MEQNREQLRQQFLNEQTVDHKEGDINPWASIKRQRHSLADAIRGECFNCVGGNHDAGATDRIKGCALNACPLWLLRPYQAGSKKLAIADAAKAIEAPPTGAVLDPVARAKTKPQSRTYAIRAYCWVCQGGGGNVNTGRQIGDCENVKCGLWDVRPYQQGKETPNPDQAAETEIDFR